MSRRAQATAERAAFFDPIDDRLLEPFYRPPSPAPASSVEAVPPASAAGGERVGRKEERPTHYRICCISLYTEDIAKLDAMVAELKRRGHTKANKSQVIRAALDQLDLSKVPKGY